MAPLADLKEKRIPAHKEGTSSENYKHLLLSVALTRSKAKEAFEGAIKMLMEADMKLKTEKEMQRDWENQIWMKWWLKMREH